jgi:hypothetical protein
VSAFLAVIKKHAPGLVDIAEVSAEPLTAYLHFRTAHQAARRAGVVSRAPWIEAMAADLADQGITIPPLWWVGHH